MRSQTKDLTLAFSSAGVGLACVAGAFYAIHEDNRFLAVILCVFAIMAGAVALKIAFTSVRRSAR